jgi:murein DD-endopeptidase MepM/ murein hydrolase activator NlpD
LPDAATFEANCADRRQIQKWRSDAGRLFQGGIVRSAFHRANRIALCTIALALTARPAARGDAAAAAAARAEAPAPPSERGAAPLYPPFQHAPLDGPLIPTGAFGEYRPGRFHAGLDLSTGEVTGKPVYAPLDGFIERVRTSGVGYGRSIYLHAADGRLILLGHLDAFDEPLASYVSAAQDTSGQYEQDLWPEAARFRVQAGQRLGWSGRSGGVGQPHLHLEVRRGDMALNPLLAGASVEDTIAPEITGITIEPRTANSRVNGRFAPLRLARTAASETVRVAGLARVEVEARDPGPKRADMQPYEIAMRWGSDQVACRFDSLSWATDMPEGDLVYDIGRLMPARHHAVLLWSSAQFRPRALVSTVPAHVEAGTLGLPGTPGILPVSVRARDLEGRETEKKFVVKFDPPGARLDSLTLRELGSTSSTWPVVGHTRGFSWLLGAESRYGPGTGWDSLKAETLAVAAAGDLIPVGRALHLAPDWLPLRKPVNLRATVPKTRPDPQLGLYTRRDGGWDLVDTSPDSSTRAAVAAGGGRERENWLSRSDDEWTRPSWIAHPSHLGEFAFFEDRLAPRIRLLRPPRHRGSQAPYSRWALEARITELGSGVNARASGFVVDGRKRPSEWDAVDQKLRWKPRTPPAAGKHHVVVIAVDKAGNERRVSGIFVIR